MKIALLSFVSEPTCSQGELRPPDTPQLPKDPLGEMVQQRLTRSSEDQVVREVLRPDLGRLKGLLLAALTDPRFDGVMVVADLPGMGNEVMVSQVESSLQQPLPAWQPLVAQLLWPHIGSNALWSHGCLGRSHRRLLAALTGDQNAVETVLDELLVPQLDHLLDWSAR